MAPMKVSSTKKKKKVGVRLGLGGVLVGVRLGQRELRRKRYRGGVTISSDEWPGGGHGAGGVTSTACSNVT